MPAGAGEVRPGPGLRRGPACRGWRPGGPDRDEEDAALLVHRIGFVPDHLAQRVRNRWLAEQGRVRASSTDSLQGHLALVALAPGAAPEEVTPGSATRWPASGPQAKSVQFSPPQPPPQLAEIRQVRTFPRRSERSWCCSRWVRSGTRW